MTNPSAQPSVLMPMIESAGTRLPVLRARLRAVRTRSRVRSMLRGAVFGLVAALALLCGLEISGLYFDVAASGGALALLPEYPLSYHACSAAAFACAFALVALLAFLRTPDAAALARKADRVLALQERLSTGLEVDQRLPPDAALGPVPSALLTDAQRHAATSEPRQIAGLPPPPPPSAEQGLVRAAVVI